MRFGSVLIGSIVIGAAVGAYGTSPYFGIQPQDQTVDSGTSVGFYSVANGDGPLYYQWYHEETPIAPPIGAGIDRTTLSLLNVKTNDAGAYHVVVTNLGGAVTSMVGHLTVIMRAPIVTEQPANQTVCEGTYVSFRAAAVGSRPLHYEWQFNGSNIFWSGNLPDCNGIDCGLTILGFPSYVTITNAGEYRVIFTNAFGAVTSQVARLTVDTSPPQIIEQPENLAVLIGEYVRFNVGTYAPCGTLHFQWRHDGMAITNSDSYYFVNPSARTNDAGNYDVVVSNSYGAVTSQVARLTVTNQAPQILQDPQNEIVYAGNTASFFVSVRAGPPADLQWRFKGTNISNATNSILYVYATSTNQSGGYSVVATNYLGSVTSAVAVLTVLENPPVFQSEPVSQQVVMGYPVILGASAAGYPPPTYQWRFNGTNMPGATNSYVSFLAVSTNNAGDYTVVAANEAGSITSRVATLVVSLPGPIDRWAWRNPLPQGGDLREVAYGNGTWVAMGDDGIKVSSHDGGVTWYDRTEGDGWPGGIAYGNGIFVRAGYHYSYVYARIIETSPDGIVWTERPLANSADPVLNDVAFGNGRFVAVGNLSALVSTNGVDWAEYSLQGHPASRLAFGNGIFLGIGVYPDGEVLISTNGETWTRQQANLQGYTSDITFGMGQFVVCGSTYEVLGYNTRAFASADGVLWQTNVVGFGFPASSIAYGNGRFVIVGGSSNGVAAVSTDATNWTVNSVTQSHQLYGVGFGGGNFVAVGNYGNIVSSSDGLTWTARSSGSDVNLRSVTRGANTYVAVGNEGLLFTCSNGVSWTRQTPPTTNNIRGVTFGGAASRPPLFVAVGEADSSGGLILTSSNGVAWSRAQTAFSLGLYAVTFADGLFMAVGEGILISSNGVNWTLARGNNGDRFNAITHAPGIFVTVGRGGKILVSGNGTIWVDRSTDSTLFLQGVAYGNNRFVAGGRAGTIAISTNGFQWTTAINALDRGIEDIHFGNNLFFAVGASGLIASSPDGIIWTKHRAIRSPTLRSIIYADGHLLTVGNNESILQSAFFGPPVLRLRLPLTGEGLEFSVEGEVGRDYRVQGSANLHDWIDLLSFRNSNQETTLVLDEDAPDLPQRFYRVISP